MSHVTVLVLFLSLAFYQVNLRADYTLSVREHQQRLKYQLVTVLETQQSVKKFQKKKEKKASEYIFFNVLLAGGIDLISMILGFSKFC